MGRRHDQARVLHAQLEGATLRISDLEHRRDLTEIERARWLGDARTRVTELEAEISGSGRVVSRVR